MSGAEAIAAIQLIDACIGITNTIVDIGRAVHDAQGLPPKLRELLEKLPAIQELLESAQETCEEGRITEDASKNAQPILKQCKEALAELKEIFRKACPKDGENRTKRTWRGTKTVFFGRDSQVQKLLVTIQDNLKLLEQKEIYVIGDKLDALQQVTEALADNNDGKYLHTGEGNIFANEGGSPTNYAVSGSNNRQINNPGVYHEGPAISLASLASVHTVPKVHFDESVLTVLVLAYTQNTYLQPTFVPHINVVTGTGTSLEVFEKKVTACRNALFLTDPYIIRGSLISTKGTRVAGTCEWIKQNAEYQSWLHGDTHLLWISGGPGKGKTMLSIFLTEELERIVQNRGDAKLIFTFCSHQDEKRNTAVALLRGLVDQIIRNCPKLVKPILPYFESPERVQQTLSSFETLWIIFTRLIQDVDLGTMFCLLDGLDECDEYGLRVLVPKLVDMFSQPPTKTFKLVIISRDIPGLRGCTHVDLNRDNEERVASDIERFITDRVGKLSIEGLNNEFRATVQNTLLERSQGTFLWIGFVVNELSQKRTCTEVLETLEDLPSGLPAIYSRMLLKTKNEHRRTSSTILRWVTMAFRPLTLQELAAAIGIQSPSTLITTERAIRDQVALCGPLLKLEGEEVVLAHQSARDYLLRKERDSDADIEEFRIEPEEAHLELARACFDCIAQSILQYTPLDVENGSGAQGSPLLEYAVLHWPEHARRCSTHAIKLFDLSRPFFQKTSDLRKNWWETYGRAKPWPRPSTLPLLHIACRFGIIPWVRALVGEKTCMSWFYRPADEKDEHGRTALSHATSEGHVDVVRLLLDRGADVNTTDKDNLTALHRAADQGHGEVIRWLLDSGADVNAKDPDGLTALRRAASRGNMAVMKRLLNGGADINAKDNEGQTALHLAASQWHEALVGWLLDGRADVNTKDNDGLTALHRAVGHGHEAIWRLRHRGANTHVWMALHRTTSRRHTAVVGRLLEGGADANTKDKDGLTALHRAASRGHTAVVALLLNGGANSNAKDNDGWTPLHQAVNQGYITVVFRLLDRAADVNAKDNSRWTPLHRVADQGYTVIVGPLLNSGADVNAKDNDGWTPLHRAVNQGHAVVVGRLLDGGADVNARAKDGLTALHRAASRGHDAMWRPPDRGANTYLAMALHFMERLLDGVANSKAKGKIELTALPGFRRQTMVVGRLLNGGADVNAKDDDGRTALHRAVSQGHMMIVFDLLNYKADFNAKDNNGWTALHQAASQGQVFVVGLLLNNAARVNARFEVGLALHGGADANAKDNDGWTPLHRAADQGHDEVIQRLLDGGAEANAKDNNGWTSLHRAANQGHYDVIGGLLGGGADVDAKDKDGLTALHRAASCGHDAMRQPPDPRAPYMSIMHLVGRILDVPKDKLTTLCGTAPRGHAVVVMRLLDGGADVNAKDNNGRTALRWAASQGDWVAVGLLLNSGADVNAKDNNGCTALHQGAGQGQAEVVVLLLKQEADVNLKDNDGWTSLHRAADQGHTVEVALLLNHKADVNAKDDGGWTSLHRAADRGHAIVVGLLLKHEADVNSKDNDGWTSLHRAADQGHAEVVGWLLNSGADVNAKDNDGWTSLHRAADQGHAEVVGRLLNSGADVNAKDNDGWTSLQQAADQGHTVVVGWLLNSGADVNAKDNDGWTALHQASNQGYAGVVKWLLDSGADVNAKDNDGSTALHLAADSTEVVWWLLNSGADINVKDSDGWTSLERTAWKGNKVLVKLFKLARVF
ncbi:ankyrin repeat protein [Paraphaeosphaeria sporulosa]